MSPFHPVVVHRIPGRMRLKLPAPARYDGLADLNLSSWNDYFTGTEGIREVRYDSRSGRALITYDPAVLSEEIILGAIDRFAGALSRAAIRFLVLPASRRIVVTARLKEWLAGHPVDLRSDSPLEIPDDLWR